MSCDLLMWVGKNFYPTPEDFLTEAKKRGACKRIARFPQHINFGETRMFLIHPDVDGQPAIFAYFVISKAEMIGEVPPELKDKIKPVAQGVAQGEPERGCGSRKEGALYLVSYYDDEGFKELAQKSKGKVDMQGKVVKLKAPVFYPWPHSRGFMYVNGDRIVKGELAFALPPKKEKDNG